MYPQITLINPPSDCVEDDRVEPPLGMLYIISTLKEASFLDVTLNDMSGCHSKEEISLKIESLKKSDIYGICSFSTNYHFVKRIISKIKDSYPDAYIILGGPQATAMPDFCLADSGAHAVVCGEGEDEFSRLVREFLQGQILKGIFFGKGRQDIDTYKFPDRTKVDNDTYSRTLCGKKTISMISSRGCVNQCTHCNSIVMGGGSSQVRYRSPDNIIKEIQELRSQFSGFRFNDDHFTGNPRLKELLKKIKETNIVFRIFARVDDLDEETCRLLKEAGCAHITIGLESLNEDNLKFLKKHGQIGKECNVANAKKFGMIVRASFIVGLPYDTDKNIETYFNVASNLCIDEFSIYPLIPYPGTLLWKDPKSFGYEIVNKDFTSYVQMGKNKNSSYSLSHKNFNAADVRRWHKKATQIMESKGIVHMGKSEVAK